MFLNGILRFTRWVPMHFHKSYIQGHYGHVYEHPMYATLFFLSGLGPVGFPLTPTFVGVDAMLSHIEANETIMIVLLGINYFFIEVAALRIFSRMFLGPHKKVYHEIAFKSS